MRTIFSDIISMKAFENSGYNWLEATDKQGNTVALFVDGPLARAIEKAFNETQPKENER